MYYWNFNATNFRNILTIETESEVKEFIGSLLDLSITKNKKFLDELLARLKKPAEVPDVTVIYFI